jgi:hypothetical protein
VPGSYLIISCGSGNRSEGENFATEYTAARIYIHSLEEILGFFDRFDLVPLVWSRCGAGTATARIWAWTLPPRPTPAAWPASRDATKPRCSQP